MTTIRIERHYAHPPEKVWHALTDRELLGQWLMPNDFEPRVGHRFTFTTEPAPGFDGVVRCEVLRVEAPCELSFTWVGGPIDTVVTFTLEPADGGTRFRMQQAGFQGLKGWLVSRMLGRGSRTIYGRYLPELLDRMDDQGRLREVPETPKECITTGQKVIARVVGVFSRKE